MVVGEWVNGDISMIHIRNNGGTGVKVVIAA